MSHLEPAGEHVSGHEELPRSAREGLPPSYRMRADAHYVDLLTSRPTDGRERTLPVRDIESPPLAERSSVRPLIDSVARHGVLQPLLVQTHQGKYRLIAGHKRLSAAVAAGLSEVPCRLFDVDDDEAVRLASAASIGGAAAAQHPPDTTPGVEADLEKSLGVLAACTDLLSGAESDLSREVAQTLLRAEIWRATGLVKAAQVLKQDAPLTRTTVRLSSVLDQVMAGFAPERKLRPLELQLTRSIGPIDPMDNDAIVVTNERLLVVAIVSAVRALVDICGPVSHSVHISVAGVPGGHLTVTVSQNTIALPDSVISRAFSPDWTDRPGGQAARITALALRHSAALLGGNVEMHSADRAVKIALTIPVGFEGRPRS